MTTQLTLTHEGVELVVTGEYMPAFDRGCIPSEFQIERIEQDGHDVTEHYRKFRVIPLLEEMAREVVESN